MTQLVGASGQRGTGTTGPHRNPGLWRSEALASGAALRHLQMCVSLAATGSRCQVLGSVPGGCSCPKSEVSEQVVAVMECLLLVLGLTGGAHGAQTYSFVFRSLYRTSASHRVGPDERRIRTPKNPTHCCGLAPGLELCRPNRGQVSIISMISFFFFRFCLFIFGERGRQGEKH